MCLTVWSQEKAAFHEAVYAGYLQLAKENSGRIANIERTDLPRLSLRISEKH